MSNDSIRQGNRVHGERCPTCRRETVVYNGNYFCTNCPWAMGEQGRPKRIMIAYLQQCWLEARNEGNQAEMDRIGNYLEPLIRDQRTRR